MKEPREESRSPGPEGPSHIRIQEVVRDIVIGMADGLTVPFALAAGLAGALPSTRLVVMAGFSEIAAGCVAMGLGAYLAVMSDHDFFHAEQSCKMRSIESDPIRERMHLADTIRKTGASEELVEGIVNTITADERQWLDFVMKYHVGAEHPSRERARNSSLTIGLSYVIGGIIPLAPRDFLIASPCAQLTQYVDFTIG